MDWPEFHDLLKDALTNLYDFAYLRGHPLLDLLAPDKSMPTPARVNALRSAITDAIELLAPDARVPRSAREWRPHLAMRYAYIEYLSAEEVQTRLGLGERQIMRERLRGIEAVAEMLWERLQAPDATREPSEPEWNQTTSVDHELVDLGVQRELLNTAELVADAVASVQPLADSRSVTIRTSVAPGEPLFADRTLLRQTLIASLGIAIQRANAGLVELEAQRDEQALLMTVKWRDGEPTEEDRAWPSLQSLVGAQMGSCAWSQSAGQAALAMRLPIGPPATILAIDDNDSSLRLLERLLTAGGYQVLTAADGYEGLRMATAQRPDLILLDVMMRGMDGWEVLLKLKAMPETRQIPVVVCSVLGEADLAASLGASGFAQKPLRRLELLATIRGSLAAKHSPA